MFIVVEIAIDPYVVAIVDVEVTASQTKHTTHEHKYGPRHLIPPGPEQRRIWLARPKAHERTRSRLNNARYPQPLRVFKGSNGFFAEPAPAPYSASEGRSPIALAFHVLFSWRLRDELEVLRIFALEGLAAVLLVQREEPGLGLCRVAKLVLALT